MISRNLNFFEFLKFRQGGGIGVFVKNSIFQKFSKFIIPHNNELVNKTYNISESGGVEFPIFGVRFIFTKFCKNEFSFWKKSRILLVLAVLRVLPTNTWVYLQYSSSCTWFLVNRIFSKFWNFIKRYWRFCVNHDFSKKCQIQNSSIYGIVKQNI
jgi:hypothetical protein